MDQDHAELEARVDAALRRLPPPHAPAGFAARVAAAARAQTAGGPAMPAPVDPLAARRRAQVRRARAIGLAGAAAAVMAADLYWPSLTTAWHAAMQSPLAGLARIAIRDAQPLAGVAFIYMASMCAACAAAAAMLTHVALGGASQS